MASLEINYRTVLEKTAGHPVQLLAVSKTQPASLILELYKLGHRDFAENYAQELAEKAEFLHASCPELRWHFIGHLQTNKVKALVPWVQSIHTVDSEKLAQEISKRADTVGKKIEVFIEVNIDGESSKSGVKPDETIALAKVCSNLSGLDLRGLMCIPTPGPEVKNAFEKLRELEKTTRPFTHGQLSMGMSGDYEIAMSCGATHVRVGSAIFGERKNMSNERYSDVIEKRIELKAPISRVWRALTDYREFGEWFRVKLEGPFVVGQTARGNITYPGYEHYKWEAVVQKMETEKLFSFTWHPYAIDLDVDYSTETPTLIEFKLEKISTGTLLLLKESGFDNVPDHRRLEAFRMNDGGWTEQMKNIERHVE